MKTITVLLTAAALSLPFAAQAEFAGPGVPAAVTTVAAAQKAADDTPVTLEGKIVRQIDHKRYEFRDATGSMTVKISQKRLPAQKIDPNSKLRIVGEVDKELTSTKVDAKLVEVLP
ncbi:NirD/YgiW/YdeI family stress tolerance protein [Chromobacterium sp. S0633]|uniref:NirD/YgiW/YdeI family stress tolerance protein n=1 Tax=Chromobacterium sp. S0633 TaxID=2957805 RepID=UPI00209EE221|nr:NirD/YgiW/YdeI family stress tolerance protein [Chromobacterium sp. S0633]MCP1289299.1 NirD/YgiW/YdeI family stress tolerance protein [Chromobacterium sp. S0633]